MFKEIALNKKMLKEAERLNLKPLYAYLDHGTIRCEMEDDTYVWRGDTWKNMK